MFVPHTSGGNRKLLGCLVSLLINSTALAMIRRAVSPMPIGRTPGFLSRAMSRQARRGEIALGSTYEVQILLVTIAKLWHRSLEAPLKDVHSLLHPCASKPEGPVDPVMCRAADIQSSAFGHGLLLWSNSVPGVSYLVGLSSLSCSLHPLLKLLYNGFQRSYKPLHLLQGW